MRWTVRWGKCGVARSLTRGGLREIGLPRGAGLSATVYGGLTLLSLPLAQEGDYAGEVLASSRPTYGTPPQPKPARTRGREGVGDTLQHPRRRACMVRKVQAVD